MNGNPPSNPPPQTIMPSAGIFMDIARVAVDTVVSFVEAVGVEDDSP